MNRIHMALLCALLGAAVAVDAQINVDMPPNLGPAQQRPGSILVYPVLDSVTGQSETLITVTNVSNNRQAAPNPTTMRGSVQVHLIWVTLNGGGTCQADNTRVILSPGDTFTTSIRALTLIPAGTAIKGFLYAFAEDATDGTPINFNALSTLGHTSNPGYPATSGLIGQATVVGFTTNNENYFYALPALSIRSRVTQGVPTTHGYFPSDLNADQEADFDNAEYDAFPQILSGPNYLNQASAAFTDELVLFTPLYDAFGQGRIDLRTYWYNFNEESRSRTFSFTCWTKVQIRTITTYTSNLPFPSPAPSSGEMNTGWFYIDPFAIVRSPAPSSDPPVHGAFIHEFDVAGASPFWSATNLWQEGTVPQVAPTSGNKGNGLPLTP